MTEGKQRDEMKLYQTFRISYDLNFNSTFNQMSMGEKKKNMEYCLCTKIIQY